MSLKMCKSNQSSPDISYTLGSCIWEYQDSSLYFCSKRFDGKNDNADEDNQWICLIKNVCVVSSELWFKNSKQKNRSKKFCFSYNLESCWTFRDIESNIWQCCDQNKTMAIASFKKKGKKAMWRKVYSKLYKKT